MEFMPCNVTPHWSHHSSPAIKRDLFSVPKGFVPFTFGIGSHFIKKSGCCGTLSPMLCREPDVWKHCLVLLRGLKCRELNLSSAIKWFVWRRIARYSQTWKTTGLSVDLKHLWETLDLWKHHYYAQAYQETPKPAQLFPGFPRNQGTQQIGRPIATWWWWTDSWSGWR